MQTVNCAPRACTSAWGRLLRPVAQQLAHGIAGLLEEPTWLHLKRGISVFPVTLVLQQLPCAMS